MKNERTVFDRKVSIPNYSKYGVNQSRRKRILSSSKQNVPNGLVSWNELT